MQINLTQRQQEIYQYLLSNQDEFKFPPSLEQLCEALGLSSRGSMHKHIQALIEAGLVEPMHGQQRGIRLTENVKMEAKSIPFLGYIAAGQPIEALEIPEMVVIPHWLSTSKSCYALQVRGDSMIDDGILDGDWVIIEKCSSANNGDIVVALIDGNDATLKRIEQKPGKILLHPANSTMKALSYKPDQVQIQGVLVGQMRSYH